MPLLGIYGPHASGKTFALDRLMGGLKYTGLPVTCVRADSGLEFLWYGETLIKDASRREEYWRGKRASKEVLLDELICGDDRLYVVESARFFSGLQSHVAQLFTCCGGGAEFILLTISDTAIFDLFLRERARRSARATYREGFWTHNKLTVEGCTKYSKHLPPVFDDAGLPYSIFDIDEDRSAWHDIDALIWDRVSRPLDDWYA